MACLSLLVLLVLAACGDDDATTDDDATMEDDATDEAEAAVDDTTGEGEESEERDGDEEVTLRLGVYAYITEIWDFAEIVANYEEANPHVTVDVQPIPGTEQADLPEVVQRYSLEARQDEATYDILLGPTAWMEVAPLAEAGALEPIDAHIPDEILDGMIPSVREESTYSDGAVYVLPMWTDVVGFIYRTDVVEDVTGSTDPPETWEDVIELAEVIEAADPDMHGYGADWPHSHRLFLPIFTTLTDEPYVDDRWHLEDDAAVETLELIQELHQYMPDNAAQDLGSSETFQAGRVGTMTYWQPQLARAIEAGIPEEDVALAANPHAVTDSTIFWNAGAVLQAASPNHEEAVRFMVEGILTDEQAVQASFDTMKVVPFEQSLELVDIPEWAEPLVEQLDTATPIPMTPLFINHMQPIYREEVERMLLQGQSPEETRDNMLERIQEAQDAGGGLPD